MNKDSRVNYLNNIFFSLAVAGILIFGYFFGSIIGKGLISGFVTDEKINSFLLYRPASQYLNIYRLVNSLNEIERLSGYYALLDNNIIDTDFLYVRYKNEKEYIKRSIIWILGQSHDFDKVKGIYEEIFPESGILIKKEILEALKMNDKSYFKSFIKKFKVGDDLLKELY